MDRFPVCSNCRIRPGLRILGFVDIVMSAVGLGAFIVVYSNPANLLQKCGATVTFHVGMVSTFIALGGFLILGTLFLLISFKMTRVLCLVNLGGQVVSISLYVLGLVLLTSPGLCTLDHYVGDGIEGFRNSLNLALSLVTLCTYKFLELYVLCKCWQDKPEGVLEISNEATAKKSGRDSSYWDDDEKDSVPNLVDLYHWHSSDSDYEPLSTETFETSRGSSASAGKTGNGHDDHHKRESRKSQWKESLAQMGLDNRASRVSNDWRKSKKSSSGRKTLAEPRASQAPGHHRNSHLEYFPRESVRPSFSVGTGYLTDTSSVRPSVSPGHHGHAPRESVRPSEMLGAGPLTDTQTVRPSVSPGHHGHVPRESVRPSVMLGAGPLIDTQTVRPSVSPGHHHVPRESVRPSLMVGGVPLTDTQTIRQSVSPGHHEHSQHGHVPRESKIRKSLMLGAGPLTDTQTVRESVSPGHHGLGHHGHVPRESVRPSLMVGAGPSIDTQTIRQSVSPGHRGHGHLEHGHDHLEHGHHGNASRESVRPNPHVGAGPGHHGQHEHHVHPQGQEASSSGLRTSMKEAGLQTSANSQGHHGHHETHHGGPHTHTDLGGVGHTPTPEAPNRMDALISPSIMSMHPGHHETHHGGPHTHTIVDGGGHKPTASEVHSRIDALPSQSVMSMHPGHHETHHEGHHTHTIADGGSHKPTTSEVPSRMDLLTSPSLMSMHPTHSPLPIPVPPKKNSASKAAPAVARRRSKPTAHKRHP